MRRHRLRLLSGVSLYQRWYAYKDAQRARILHRPPTSRTSPTAIAPQSSNRMGVERTFGLFVRRFGVFWRPLEIRFDRRAPLIIAAMKLHNFCIERKIELEMNQRYGVGQATNQLNSKLLTSDPPLQGRVDRDWGRLQRRPHLGRYAKLRQRRRAGRVPRHHRPQHHRASERSVVEEGAAEGCAAERGAEAAG